YRPDGLRAPARHLQPRLADPDLFRSDAARQVHPRPAGPARLGRELDGVGRVHRLGLAYQPVPAVHRRAHAQLFRAQRRRRPAAGGGEPPCAPDERRARPRRGDPGGARSRREPGGGCEMVAADRERRLPDHAPDGREMAGREIDVLFVASECAPLVKTGGLADVVGALPRALSGTDCRVRVLIPAYAGVAERAGETGTLMEMPDLFGGPARLLAGGVAGLDVLLLEAPHHYNRGGGPYQDSGFRDWPDNHLRFGALCRIAAEIGRAGLPGGWR